MDGPGAGRGAEASMTHWRPCMLPRAHGALGARPGGLSPGSPTTSASAIGALTVALLGQWRWLTQPAPGPVGEWTEHVQGMLGGGESWRRCQRHSCVWTPPPSRARAVNQVTCDDSPGQGLARNCDHHNTGLR